METNVNKLNGVANWGHGGEEQIAAGDAGKIMDEQETMQEESSEEVSEEGEKVEETSEGSEEGESSTAEE